MFQLQRPLPSEFQTVSTIRSVLQTILLSSSILTSTPSQNTANYPKLRTPRGPIPNFQEQFHPNAPQRDNQTTRWHREVRAEVKSFMNTTPTTQATPVSISEVKRLIKESNHNSAPGLDGVTYETSRTFPTNVSKSSATSSMPH